MTPKCSDLVWGMTLGYPRNEMVWGFQGHRLWLGTAIFRGLELHEWRLLVVYVSLQISVCVCVCTVVVLCASGDTVRKIMLKAAELHFDNGEYVFVNIDLFSTFVFCFCILLY